MCLYSSQSTWVGADSSEIKLNYILFYTNTCELRNVSKQGLIPSKMVNAANTYHFFLIFVALFMDTVFTITAIVFILVKNTIKPQKPASLTDIFRFRFHPYLFMSPLSLCNSHVELPSLGRGKSETKTSRFTKRMLLTQGRGARRTGRT